MRKFFITSFLAISFLFLAGCTNNTPSEVKASKMVQDEKDASFLTLFSSPTTSKNRVWIGTFQLVFNDMKNELLKVKRVKFVDEDESLELKGLNDEEFNSGMLQESSYYTSYGLTSPEAKEKIKRDIKAKFNETSDVLDNGDWSKAKLGQRKYYAYAMLKKEFSFLKEFDILDEDSFNESTKKYNYFGIDSNSKDDLYNNVQVLFYNDKDDYAVQLITKENDIIYLYRTQKTDDFKSLFNRMNAEKQAFGGKTFFQGVDTLKVPNLKFAKVKQYPFLTNKTIEDTNGMYFNLTIETIKFELDNKGGKVKSEALLMAQDNAIMLEPEEIIPRHFDFDKTFVLFLVDKGKTEPYMALRVEDLEEFQK